MHILAEGSGLHDTATIQVPQVAISSLFQLTLFRISWSDSSVKVAGLD